MSYNLIRYQYVNQYAFTVHQSGCQKEVNTNIHTLSLFLSLTHTLSFQQYPAVVYCAIKQHGLINAWIIMQYVWSLDPGLCLHFVHPMKKSLLTDLETYSSQCNAFVHTAVMSLLFLLTTKNKMRRIFVFNLPLKKIWLTV